MSDDGFLMFLARWTVLQRQDLPRLHVRIARWLERRTASRDEMLLLMAFRGSGKSTLVGLYAAWLLTRDPSCRILVLSADQTLAVKMARSVRRIVERHPDCAHLKPDRPEEWAVDRFTVRRPAALRDPSLIARGIAANLTGSHADVVIADDVEVPNTCDTAPKRADLRERLLELEHVLVPGGVQLFVGTPHTWWSIYSAQPRPEAGEDRPFLDGARRLVLPVTDGAGCPAWPERFPEARIAAIRRRAGPAKFASQMMLEPVNLTEGRLDPDRLRPYAGALDYSEAQGRAVLRLEGRALVGAACWWDPAFGRAAATADGSVIACVFSDAEGRRYLHGVEWLAVPTEEEAAQAQCAAVARFMAANHLRAVHVETNGIGRFLPGLLRRTLVAAGLPGTVREISNRRPKALRILEAWDAPLAAGMLWAHRGIWNTRLPTEMRSWRPDRARGHDDGLDAVAGCLSVEPERLGPLPTATPRPDWRPGTAPRRAEAGFDP
jgi:hypothetical protein